jgi:8-oxo-dGTP pyrophosphatase MutT (NUDIX family)
MSKTDVDEVRQSGVIPYRQNNGQPEVLLITSMTRGRWIVPKGNPMDGLSLRESAIQEAYEEAGVRGRVPRSRHGEYRHSGGGGSLVEVYLMEVESELDDWPEAADRERQWVPIARAIELVEDAGLKTLLAKLEVRD